MTEFNDLPDQLGSLTEFASRWAELVASWPRSQAEVEAWCSLRQARVSPDTIMAWGRPDDVEAFVYLIDDVAAAYGELWFDDDEEEVELGHLIVDPERRNRSVGRHLARSLTRRARERHDLVVLRVRQENASAFRSYLQAGFRRAGKSDEAAWNQGQPHNYIWMTAS